MIQIFKVPYITKTKNPNAGNTIYQVPIGTRTYVKSRVPLEHVNLWFLTAGSKQIGDPNTENYQIVDVYEYQLIKDKSNTIKEILDKYPDETIECETINDYDTIHTLTPEPSFLYTYDLSKLEVQCYECQSKFMASELLFEDDDWLSAYYSSSTVCPVCGKWDCCVLEYEK